MEVTVIDPTQFGIEKEKAEGIEQAFATAIEERKGLAEIYGQLIVKEMTLELCEEAKEFDKKLLKIEKDITAIHKTQKDFSLQYGRLCDAWKNKEIEPVKQMREKIGEIKKHFELVEAKRVADLHLIRKAELDAVGFEGDLNLGELSETVYVGILQGAKLSHAKSVEDARIAEEQAKEAARLEAITQERRLALAKYEAIIQDQTELSLDALLEATDEFFDQSVLDLAAEMKRRHEEAIASKAEVARLAEELAEKEKAEREAKEAQAKLDAEAKAERDAIQAELDAAKKAKSDSEIAERVKAEQEAAEAAKLALAPVKEQLTKWVSSLNLSSAPVDHTTAKDIETKFDGFKRWALGEISKL